MLFQLPEIGRVYPEISPLPRVRGARAGGKGRIPSEFRPKRKSRPFATTGASFRAFAFPRRLRPRSVCRSYGPSGLTFPTPCHGGIRAPLQPRASPVGARLCSLACLGHLHGGAHLLHGLFGADAGTAGTLFE